MVSTACIFKSDQMIEGEKRKMKYVLGITDEYRNLWIEDFDTKEELLAFFEEPFFEFIIINIFNVLNYFTSTSWLLIKS